MKLGFTLMELMIVVAIIAVLSSVAMLSYRGQIDRAKDANVLKIMAALRGSIANEITSETTGASIYVEKISGIKKYLSPTLANNMEIADDTVAIDDFITSYQVRAGKVEKDDGTSSVGTAGKYNLVVNVAEIYYDNRYGRLYIDGVGASDNSIKVYKDTAKRYWKDF